MLTGVFRDRTRQRTAHTAADVLWQLLQARSLKPHRFHRNSEIGPFLVEYVCLERALIVELRDSLGPKGSREQNRRALLQELGFGLLSISQRELLARPDHALARIRAALR